MIAEAIIGLLLFFYNSKNLNCIGVLSFFQDLFKNFLISEVKLAERGAGGRTEKNPGDGK